MHTDPTMASVAHKSDRHTRSAQRRTNNTPQPALLDPSGASMQFRLPTAVHKQVAQCRLGAIAATSGCVVPFPTSMHCAHALPAAREAGLWIYAQIAPQAALATTNAEDPAAAAQYSKDTSMGPGLLI
jgi:hypothetical protein